MSLNALTLLSMILAVNMADASHWGYTLSEQSHWADSYPACGGHQQSPIAISENDTIPISLPSMRLIGYQDPLPEPLDITNNGHSVAITIRDYTIEEKKQGYLLPYIYGGPLKGFYELEEIHFHWGRKYNPGSEHTLNGKRLPFEMHVIHRNKKYENRTEALQYADGMCVLGFLYQVVDFEATHLSPIIKNLTMIETCDTTAQLPHTFALNTVVAGLNTENFYTYQGSLTTPPCSEALTWVMFPDFLPVSVSQMAQLHTIKSNMNISIDDNFRTLQPLYDRKIYKRISTEAMNPQTHFSQWDWVGKHEAENEVNTDDDVDYESEINVEESEIETPIETPQTMLTTIMDKLKKNKIVSGISSMFSG